jgi:hypothetical protein
MDPKSFLALSIAAALAPVALSYSIEEQQLCIVTLTATAAPVCPEKMPVQFHVDRQHKIFEVVLPPVDEMPFLLRNAAANFLAAENPPRRHDFVQPDQQAWNHALYDLKPGKPTKPEGEPPPEHIEPPTPEAAINPGAMSGVSTATSSAYGMLGSYVSAAPQFFENPAPVYSPAQRGNLVVVVTPQSGNSSDDHKEFKAPPSRDQPHDHHEPVQLELALEPSMPPADAWPHFDDDGYTDDSIELAA